MSFISRRNFYPRSPCGERHRIGYKADKISAISIHALLAESDSCRMCGLWERFIFLSTLSLRRATLGAKRRPCMGRISIHALLAESDSGRRMQLPAPGIFLSTLSLRRATLPSLQSVKMSSHFYPRSPCGERPTPLKRETHTRRFLSTLSLRRATDEGSLFRDSNSYFYPRSPCGERLAPPF